MKVVALFLSFPTPFYESQSDARSSTYGLCGEQVKTYKILQTVVFAPGDVISPQAKIAVIPDLSALSFLPQ
ncbi:hypothetical protein A2U01_0073175, partial [Trifolium medium]|nr:hypothetical protein [Trifolium medium]